VARRPSSASSNKLEKSSYLCAANMNNWGCRCFPSAITDAYLDVVVQVPLVHKLPGVVFTGTQTIQHFIGDG
jgi:hypothetical protein